MKIRVTSDGRPMFTKIIDAETGEELKNIKRLVITIDADEPNATVVVEALKLDEIGRPLVIYDEASAHIATETSVAEVVEFDLTGEAAE
jgi:hypothetical protein